MPAGRPSIYSEELATKVLDSLAEGNSLRTACKSDDLPSMSTVFKWLRTIPEFAQQYARAKEEGATALFEEMMDIADDGTNDWMETHSKDGDAIGWRENGEALQRSRLRVDVRKWALSKILPKKYSDRIDLGNADGQPFQINVIKDFGINNDTP